jgi:hypothetical protein
MAKEAPTRIRHAGDLMNVESELDIDRRTARYELLRRGNSANFR